MGDFAIQINAVGGHGCDRHIKEGNIVHGCGRMGCPDCETRRYIRTMKNAGVDVKSATLTHWPGDPSEVKDNLLTGQRTGSF